jgi:hypothetical protein
MPIIPAASAPKDVEIPFTPAPTAVDSAELAAAIAHLVPPEDDQNRDLELTARVEHMIDQMPTALRQCKDTHRFISDLVSHLGKLSTVHKASQPSRARKSFHGSYRLPIESFATETLFLQSTYQAFREHVHATILADLDTFMHDYKRQATDLKIEYERIVKQLRSEMAYCRERRERAEAEIAKRDKALEKLVEMRSRLAKQTQIDKQHAKAEAHVKAASQFSEEYETSFKASAASRDTFTQSAQRMLERFCELNLRQLSAIHSAFSRYVGAYSDVTSHVQGALRAASLAIDDPSLAPREAVREETTAADAVVEREQGPDERLHSVRKYLRLAEFPEPAISVEDLAAAGISGN